MAPPGIIFDLDGTLLDTLGDIASAGNLVLQERGFPTHREAAYRGFIGMGVEVLAFRALPLEARQDPDLVKTVAKEIRTVYRSLGDRQTRLFPGIAPLLEALTSLQIPLAVLSNKPHEHTQAIVRRLFARWRFRAIWGARDRFPSKPHPEAALALAGGALRRRTIDTLFVGDSGVDMSTARAAGMIPVGALWGFRSGRELTLSGARRLLGRPGDLLAVVERYTAR